MEHTQLLPGICTALNCVYSMHNTQVQVVLFNDFVSEIETRMNGHKTSFLFLEYYQVPELECRYPVWRIVQQFVVYLNWHDAASKVGQTSKFGAENA